MRGLNHTVISGNISKFWFGETSAGVLACGFNLASNQHSSRGTRTVWVKVNVYGEFVNVCKTRLMKGLYVIVHGELMLREGQCCDHLEIRAHEVIFVSPPRNLSEPEPEPEQENFDGEQ